MDHTSEYHEGSVNVLDNADDRPGEAETNKILFSILDSIANVYENEEQLDGDIVRQEQTSRNLQLGLKLLQDDHEAFKLHLHETYLGLDEAFATLQNSLESHQAVIEDAEAANQELRIDAIGNLRSEVMESTILQRHELRQKEYRAEISRVNKVVETLLAFKSYAILSCKKRTQAEVSEEETADHRSERGRVFTLGA